MEHNYHIDYENVLLRPLGKDDIENLRVWRNDPRNTIYLRKIPYITVDMQMDWYNCYLKNKDELGFAIIEKNVLNRMVGSLSLHEFNGDTCFLGKILIGDVEAHGKKVGLNATKAALKIAFEKLRIKTVKLHVYSDNFVALNVYKKAGFLVVEEYKIGDGKIELTMIKEREV